MKQIIFIFSMFLSLSLFAQGWGDCDPAFEDCGTAANDCDPSFEDCTNTVNDCDPSFEDCTVSNNAPYWNSIGQCVIKRENDFGYITENVVTNSLCETSIGYDFILDSLGSCNGYDPQRNATSPIIRSQDIRYCILGNYNTRSAAYFDFGTGFNSNVCNLYGYTNLGTPVVLIDDVPPAYCRYDINPIIIANDWNGCSEYSFDCRPAINEYNEYIVDFDNSYQYDIEPYQAEGWGDDSCDPSFEDCGNNNTPWDNGDSNCDPSFEDCDGNNVPPIDNECDPTFENCGNPTPVPNPTTAPGPVVTNPPPSDKGCMVATNSSTTNLYLFLMMVIGLAIIRFRK